MSKDWKKALRAIALGLFYTLVLGGAMFYIYVIFSFGLVPIYVLQVYPYLAAAILLAVILSVSNYFGKKGKKRIALGLLAVVLVCGVYSVCGYFREKVPTLDDRSLMLEEYEPGREDSKAVRLNEPSTLQLSADNLPRLDGATALYPVYAGFVEAVYPKGEYPMYDYESEKGLSDVTCSNTVNAYERLISGETDIIFVAAPSEAQKQAAEQAGMKLYYTPIGREAFVFFVNGKNPVSNLTLEQIRGIYSGEYTNWKQLGGKNQSIRAFQRAENSGSQSALERLMEGSKLIEPEKEDRIAGMGGIITSVANYRNFSNAIGFSFRFYATEMAANDSIRLLSLNGVAPTKETIRDGSYPIASSFFLVTASPVGEPPKEETNESIALFIEWILSEQGQYIVEQTGYVSIN